MEKDKQSKLYEMLKNMSDYSIEQPEVIEKICKDIFLPQVYVPAVDLLVEAFLTVHSFSLLMLEGLISNASAILRILIEQVSTLTVICKNEKAMMSFIAMQKRKEGYYSRWSNTERKAFKNFLLKEYGYNSESAVKDYLDYGWIREIDDDRSQRSDRLIIKAAHLEEMIVDINNTLNAFAHGQLSSFAILRNKDYADKHVSRIIMATGKLFLFLCSAKQEWLVNGYLTDDKYFNCYLNAKILYTDLNSRAVSARINEIVLNNENLDREICYSINTLNHTRGLLYQADLNIQQANMLAVAYRYNLQNIATMLLYKLFPSMVNQAIKNSDTFEQVVKSCDCSKLNIIYNSDLHVFDLNGLLEANKMINDNWGPKLESGDFAELDESFINDFTTFVHRLFMIAFPNINPGELIEQFISII